MRRSGQRAKVVKTHGSIQNAIALTRDESRHAWGKGKIAEVANLLGYKIRSRNEDRDMDGLVKA